MKRMGMFLVLALSALLCSAQDEMGGEGAERSFRRSEGRGERRGGSRGGMRRDRGMMGGGMMFRRTIAEEELAQKYPKEMAEIFAARIKQEEQLAELARKAGVELPASTDVSLLKLRASDPKAFAEAVALLKTSPREGMKKLQELSAKAGIEIFPKMRRGGSGDAPGAEAPGPRAIGRVDLKALRGKYPEEMKEYDKLQSSDKEKARAYLMELIERDRRSPKEK